MLIEKTHLEVLKEQFIFSEVEFVCRTEAIEPVKI